MLPSPPIYITPSQISSPGIYSMAHPSWPHYTDTPTFSPFSPISPTTDLANVFHPHIHSPTSSSDSVGSPVTSSTSSVTGEAGTPHTDLRNPLAIHDQQSTYYDQDSHPALHPSLAIYPPGNTLPPITPTYPSLSPSYAMYIPDSRDFTSSLRPRSRSRASRQKAANYKSKHSSVSPSIVTF